MVKACSSKIGIVGKNLGFLIVGLAAGFVLANMLHRAEQDSLESPEELIDSIDAKLQELESNVATPESVS